MIPIVITLIGLTITISLAHGYFRVAPHVAAFLFGYHTLACLVFYQAFLDEPKDADHYIEQALFGEQQWGLGTKFIIELTRIVSVGGRLGALDLYLVYNAFGAIGLVALWAALRDGIGRARAPVTWVPLLVLLPGLSFWSAAVGKDALSFLAVALFAFGTIERRWKLILLSIALMFVVRPHIGFLMFGAVCLSVLSLQTAPLRYRIGIFLAVGAGFYLLLPVLLAYVGLSPTLSLDELAQFVVSRQEANQGQETSFAVSGVSLPVAIFSYLFRPIFETGGFLGLAVSLENLFLLAAVAFLFVPAIFRVGLRPSFAFRTQVIYAAMALLLLAPITGNLGIAVRQKNMILPAIFLATAIGLGPLPRRHRAGRRPRPTLAANAERAQPDPAAAE